MKNTILLQPVSCVFHNLQKASDQKLKSYLKYQIIKIVLNYFPESQENYFHTEQLFFIQGQMSLLPYLP